MCSMVWDAWTYVQMSTVNSAFMWLLFSLCPFLRQKMMSCYSCLACNIYHTIMFVASCKSLSCFSSVCRWPICLAASFQCPIWSYDWPSECLVSHSGKKSTSGWLCWELALDKAPLRSGSLCQMKWFWNKLTFTTSPHWVPVLTKNINISPLSLILVNMQKL